MSTVKSPVLPELPALYRPPPSVDRRCLDPTSLSWVLPVIPSPLQARHLGLRGSVKRREKKMVPPEEKDAAYKFKRLKNNEAAKRSRERRRVKELLLEGRLLALSNDNAQLRDQIFRLRYLAPRKENAAPCPGYGYGPPGPPSAFWGGGSSFPSGWIRGFDSLVPLPGPWGPSGLTGMEGSADASADPCSVRAFPRPDPLRPGPPAWLLPCPAVGSGFPLPWPSPCLVSTAPYPSLPLCMQDAQGQRPGLGGDAPKAFRKT